MQLVHLSEIASFVPELIVAQFPDDDGIGRAGSVDEFPSDGAEDGLAQDCAGGGQADDVAVVEIGEYSDDEDDFREFDEQSMLVAALGLQRTH